MPVSVTNQQFRALKLVS